MSKKNQKAKVSAAVVRHRLLTGLMVFGLLLNQMNLRMMSVTAGNEPISFAVGSQISAVLDNGMLTLSGQGATEDYNAQSAPFQEYAQDIKGLIIEEGITYLGAYLFYNLGSLKDELTLPESLAGIGSHAFSGDSLETAPQFSVIRNLFVSAEIAGDQQMETTVPELDETSTEITVPSDVPLDEQEAVPAEGDAINTAEPQVVPSPNTAELNPESEAESTKNAESPAPHGKMPAEDVLKIPETGRNSQLLNGLAVYKMDKNEVQDNTDSGTVQILTQQQIDEPESLFYPGQTGWIIAGSANQSFIQAAETAGYQKTEGLASAILDDKIKLQLPIENGLAALPDCPPEITQSNDGRVVTELKFAGWKLAENLPDTQVIGAHEEIPVSDREQLQLYSVWEVSPKLKLNTRAEMDGTDAVYSIFDEASGSSPQAPEGYRFAYQWQSASKSTSESAQTWETIEGAAEEVYRRSASAEDTELQLRCQLTLIELSRHGRSADPEVLYSSAVDGRAQLSVVYVDQSGGLDTNAGTIHAPVKTLDAAAALLAGNGGNVDTNQIVILGTYTLEANSLLNQNPVPTTIKGYDSTSKLIGQMSSSDYPLYLNADLCLESITVEKINHIYGQGYDITIGRDIINTSVDSKFYLYGSGQSGLVNEAVGKITVNSGQIARIVGYIRSNPSIDAKGHPAQIIVNGGTVDTIIAGSASGAVSNADTFIQVNGGKVTTLVGGNQGFNNGNSSYTGKTVIEVTGGNVNSILGAGTGRNVSIPTFSGQMEIDVSGGDVGNIYGAGSAAYVISPDSDNPSSVNISVTGGAVGNVFAAGRGGDTAVKEDGTYKFEDLAVLDQFGSLTGNAAITIGGSAVITGSVYASGEGYKSSTLNTHNNAYLNGRATIKIENGSVIEGSVYGGGQGIAEDGYQQSARTTATSQIDVVIEGGTIKNNVYGGGKTARTDGSAKVQIRGGTVSGNVYGGGEKGLVKGDITVLISSGTIIGSVYGGALGTTDTWMHEGMSVVNMTGGWIQGNLYGGSELSNDGPKTGDPQDLILVNLFGGIIKGNVFGGGYRGTINGSTHLHIGSQAPDDCAYYQAHPSEKPIFEASALTIEGSVYAGGDYGGGDALDYSRITVEGTSHVYIDGTGYNTGNVGSAPKMYLSGGVFGSGASCDAGSTRLVTLKNYGEAILNDQNEIIGVTRTLSAIQRADRVLLNNSHVRLSGQSDIANPNQTALYSLNRIGDHGEINLPGPLDSGLVLQSGSSLFLDSDMIETAGFSSVDSAGNALSAADLTGDNINFIHFNMGTIFRISYTKTQVGSADQEIYGKISGYAFMSAADTADAYAYARIKTDTENSQDGGFINPKDKTELNFTNVEPEYRYWQIRGSSATAKRYTVLTAQNLNVGDPGYPDDHFATAHGTIELPPSAAGTSYEIISAVLPSGTGLNLTEAAKNDKNEWTSVNLNTGDMTDGSDLVSGAQTAITDNPLSSFGLFMKIGNGFADADGALGKVVSDTSVISSNSHCIINQKTASTTNGSLPVIDFYLTYANNAITVSRNLGTVEIVLRGTNAGSESTLITMNIEILTQANALTDQSVDLYATQSGSYTAQLIIPSGASRSLALKKVEVSGTPLSRQDSTLNGNDYSITMKPVKSQGWQTTGLMSTAFDLAGFNAATPELLGTTDSRYQAPLEFKLNNSPLFPAKADNDTVILTLTDGRDDFKVTLNVHWKDSVVSRIQTAAGRQYNGFTDSGSTVTISQQSALTASYTLGSTESAGKLWLEIRCLGNTLQQLKGTQLTLLGPDGYYSYSVAGTETDDKIPLNAFKNMKTGSALSGNIEKDTVLTVIMDLAAANSLPSVDNQCSLRLRNETGADSMGAEFVINNTGAKAELTGGGGRSRGTQTFTLSITPNSDTRWSDSAAVLYPADGSRFPEGIRFLSDGSNYYPNQGIVILPLKGTGTTTFVMDTTESAGLSAGMHTLQADVYPLGLSAGSVKQKITSAALNYEVTADPAAGLNVTLASGSRVVSAATDTQLTFNAAYTLANTEPGQPDLRIEVTVERKQGSAYEKLDQDWTVSGNSEIAVADGSASQTIIVTVPAGLSAGTYRLNFSFAGQMTPFNLIVE